MFMQGAKRSSVPLLRPGVGGAMKSEINPMHLPMHLAARCTACSKRTGLPCCAPAVRGWSVCRMHGARGGAPQGAQNGMYRHGQMTQEVLAERRAMSDLLRQLKASLRSISCEPAS